MPKKAANLIDPSQYDQIRKVAAMLGVPHQTLESAVTIGRIASVALASGVRIVSIESAKEWAKNRPPKGRPKKSD